MKENGCQLSLLVIPREIKNALEDKRCCDYDQKKYLDSASSFKMNVSRLANYLPMWQDIKFIQLETAICQESTVNGYSHVVSRAECVSFFDADLRKYVMYSRVHLGNLIGQRILSFKIKEKACFA